MRLNQSEVGELGCERVVLYRFCADIGDHNDNETFVECSVTSDPRGYAGECRYTLCHAVRQDFCT
ncbi:MAG: hypothetical protein ACJAZO_003607 [Myxococcota bacterium]|jgi:hypothetical protein